MRTMTDKYVITIDHPKGFITLIVPDWFEKANMKSVRLVFNLLMRYKWAGNNEQAIIDFNSFFMSCPDKLKAAWDEASRDYQNNYRLPDKWYCSSRMLKDIESENKRLLDDVKKAKAKYEKICKIKTLYEELKKKFLID